MNILNITCLTAIFLPLFLAIFLLTKRIMLSIVSRHFLDYSLIFVNLVSFFCFFIYGIIPKNEAEIFNLNLSYFEFNTFNFGLNLQFNNQNIVFLIFSSLIFLLISIFAKLFFSDKKQFLFTKQRYHIFFLFVIFNSYIFFASNNLILSFASWVVAGILTFIFGYIDIYKSNVNTAISRNQKINFLGDFSFLLGILILYKNIISSDAVIETLRLENLSDMFEFLYVSNSVAEYKIALACFLLAISTRFLLLPFNCYNSFFANSSNLVYLSNSSILNSVFGLYILINLLPAFKHIANSEYILIYLAISCILSLFFILFEKNLKIIFGYLLASLNSIIFIAFLYFKNTTIIAYSYFLILFIFFFIISSRFLKGKGSLNKRIIPKQKGFIIERINIFFLETLINKTGILFSFIDEKIINPMYEFVFRKLIWLANKYQIRYIKRNLFKNARNIIIIFAILVVIVILISLIGDIECLKSIF